MAYEVKVTRQGQITIPKLLREKYMINEGDEIIYVDLGDHLAILPAPKRPVKVLEGLQVEVKKTVHQIRKEALRTAQRLVDKKLQG